MKGYSVSFLNRLGRLSSSPGKVVRPLAGTVPAAIPAPCVGEAFCRNEGQQVNRSNSRGPIYVLITQERLRSEQVGDFPNSVKPSFRNPAF